MLNQALADVRAFHVAFSHPHSEVPTPITYERAFKRAGWVRDEADELVDDTASVQESIDIGAMNEVDLITVQADACLDQIYFALGTLVELGLNVDPLWAIVQNANMSKLHMIDGVPTAVMVNGKVSKPEGWQDPHSLLRAEVERQVIASSVNAA